MIPGDVVRHADCGEPVVLIGAFVFDPAGGEHLCRDYLAWHRRPDERDPAVLDVAGGWRPAQRPGPARAA